MGKIIRNGIEYSSTVDTANNISYDNSLSGLEATTTQKAIDEVCGSLGGLFKYYESENKVTGTVTGSNTVVNTLTINEKGTYLIGQLGFAILKANGGDRSFGLIFDDKKIYLANAQVVTIEKETTFSLIPDTNSEINYYDFGLYALKLK